MTAPLDLAALDLAPDAGLDLGEDIEGVEVGVAAGDIKGNGADRLDAGIIIAPGAVTAAVTTTSTAAAAPCRWTRERVPGRTHAVVVNAGNANASTGAQGTADTRATAAMVGAALGCGPDAVLVCSTGVIGVPLPMDRLGPAVIRACVGGGSGADLARAIMTTDLVPKAASAVVDGITVCGVAKGSGMIHPGMATMLGFLVTDAAVPAGPLQRLLQGVAVRTFNAVSVDGDMSTNDTLTLQATGTGRAVEPGTPGWQALLGAVEAVATRLAMAIAADGEGATTLVECVVEGTPDDATARDAARAVVRSPLVKTAVHGRDPNWGRIVGALGAVRVPHLDRLDLDIAGVPVLRGGTPLPFDEAAASAALTAPRVVLAARLPGAGRGRAWGCDLSADYVRINADYRS